MKKKIVSSVSVVQILLAFVAYFAISKHFNDDEKIFSLLANTDFVATMLRLSIYIVPGVQLLSGLYGLTFKDKKVLYIVCICEIIVSLLSFTYVDNDKYMLLLSSFSLFISILYLFGIKNTK